MHEGSGVTIDKQSAGLPGEGFEVIDAYLDEIYGRGNYAINGVVWIVPRDEHAEPWRYDLWPMYDLGPRLDSSGTVTLAWTGDATLAQDDVERFIANLTGASPAIVSAYGDAFAKNATSSEPWPPENAPPLISEVNILNHTDLQQAWERLSASGVAGFAPPHNKESAAWSFLVDLASVRAEKTGNDGWTIHVRASDEASFTADARSSVELDERLAIARESLGLPALSVTPRPDPPTITCE